MSERLTVAQAARALGMSERTLRRRVTTGKIEAVKDTTPETGSAWFIEQATIDALLAPPLKRDAGASNSTELKGGAPEEQEVKEGAAPLALVERSAQAAQPEQSAEIVRLRDDVQQIKAFLVGQAMAEGGEQLPANLGTVIGQAMRETLAPMMERIEQQSAENALLKQQVAQALDRATQAEEREREREAASKRHTRSGLGAWWPFSKRRG